MTKKFFIFALSVVFGIFLTINVSAQNQRRGSAQNSNGQGYQGSQGSQGSQDHQLPFMYQYQHQNQYLINQDYILGYDYQNCYNYLNTTTNQWQYNGQYNRFSQNNFSGPPWFTNSDTFPGGPSWYRNPVEEVAAGPWWWQAYNGYDVSAIAPDWYVNPSTAVCIPSWYESQTSGPWWWRSLLSTTISDNDAGEE